MGDKRKMKVLEKIKRCVSLVWGFQEFCGEEEIEDFCSNELRTYPQYDEIMEYFKRIENLDKENAELKEKYVKNICDCDICDTYCNSQLIKAKEIIKTFLGFAEAFGYSPSMDKFITEAEQFIKDSEVG